MLKKKLLWKLCYKWGFMYWNGVSLVWNLKQTDTTIPTSLFTRQTPTNLKGLAE